MGVKDFRDLRIWREAFELSVIIYRVTDSFPPKEMFGVVSQIRRSGASVAANIAEGKGLNSSLSFIRHLNIAIGSAQETTTFLLLSSELGYLDQQTTNDLVRRYDGLCAGIRRSIRTIRTNYDL